MTWQAVARKDFRDAVRSKWLWALSLLFVGVFTLPPILVFYLEMGATPPQGESGTSDAFVYLMKQGTSVLIPLIAIVVAYASITQERESGSLKLLLSLPHSREDVVFGKVLGRAGVLSLPIAIGFAVAAVVILLTSLDFQFANFALFAVLTVLLGVVFVGLSVGISAAASTGRRAMVAVIGFFFWFVILWNSFANQTVNLLNRYLDLAGQTQMELVLLLKLLNPTQAYKTLIDSFLLESAVQSRVMTFGFMRQQAAAQAFGDSLPVYLSNGFVVSYLLLWLLVPVAVGYWVFENADL
ncbi:ABC transporter permease [Halorussus salilacus]|uniref:ABC transporter permease subunit n=1 Tax=Halorussus salilacus TaxID=2953750 RepID=UPI00209E00BC|nr:ABC transporter permease subunit [Halorussus salilacus]USZ67038.1 ABC transporter permease [Halorussus salilacus]